MEPDTKNEIINLMAQLDEQTQNLVIDMLQRLLKVSKRQNYRK